MKLESEISFLNGEIQEFKECLKDKPSKFTLIQWIKDSIEVFEERINNLQKCRKDKKEVIENDNS